MNRKQMIKFSHLSKQFSYEWSVYNAQGKICQGDRIWLSGNNGSGKSTLLYLLSKLYQPSRGYVTYFFDRKNLYIAGHENMFYKYFTAIQNLVFFQNLYDNVNHQNIDSVLRELHLYKVRNKEVGLFSKGMLQKLVLARMLLHKPRILFLDEPFNHLDEHGTMFLKNILENQGLPQIGWGIQTMILVDHDSIRAKRLTNVYWKMDQSHLIVK